MAFKECDNFKFLLGTSGEVCCLSDKQWKSLFCLKKKKRKKSHNEMDVLLVPWRNVLAVCQSVCNWAVGQFGSTVLIRGERITWFAECFAIGFVLLRLVTAPGGRPSPLLFIRPTGYFAILFCCSSLPNPA